MIEIKKYANSLVGNRFIRHSKYVKGSYTLGVVGSAEVVPSFASTEYEVLFHSRMGDFTRPSGQIYLRYHINIVSTNGIEYDYNELHFMNK